MSSQVDINELAREKVSEIERLLNSGENHKLELVTSWFIILKQIITAADLHRTNENQNCNPNNESKRPDDAGESIYADYIDDNERINTGDLTEQFATNSVKWTIRVHAFKQVRRLVQSLKLKHLPDLVRLSFVAATSPYDDLKLQGFESFKYIINRFAHVEEKELPGHSILEQYRTQIISAIKPAFNLDAPPYITAVASQVCCSWICQGLEKDAAGLKRAYQLMMATIDKLDNQSVNQNSKLYTESELELERLDILASWAQLFVKAKELNDSDTLNENNILGQLVGPQINSFVDKWWDALRDYALLIIPKSKSSKTVISSSHENENVYTREEALRLFGSVWFRLVHATSIWLCTESHKVNEVKPDLAHDDEYIMTEHDKVKYMNFLCGIIMKELCDFAHSIIDLKKQNDFMPESSLTVIKSLMLLLKSNDLNITLKSNLNMASEFYRVLHSILTSRPELKSEHRVFIKYIMETILIIILEKIESDHKGLMIDVFKHLLYAVSENLTSLEKDDTRMSINTNLSLRLSNMILMTKLTIDNISEDYSLKELLLSNIDNAISHIENPSTVVELILGLDNFATIHPMIYLSLFAERLYVSKIRALMRIYKSLKVSGNSRQSSMCIADIEVITKSLRNDIANVNQDTKLKIIREFLTALVSFSSPNPKLDSNQKAAKQTCEREATQLGTNTLKDILKMFPNEVEQVFTSEPSLKDGCNSICDQKGNTKPSDEVNNCSSDKTKTTRTATTKIVLKTDFGNFYSNKSGK